MAKQLKIGIEEAGRKARYEFLQRAALEHRCDLIATAHTRDDHVETVLLNLVRGTGMSGLCGIPSRRENVVRPILPFSRAETRAYCVENGLWFHDDPANSDPAFARSRLRLNVLPELRLVNPATDEAVVRMAEILAEEDGFLNGMAASALEQSEIDLNGNLKFLTADCEVAFSRAKLCSYPVVLVKRGLRLAVGVVGGGLDRDQTALLTHGLRFDPRGSVTAEGGRTVVEWDEHTVHVRDIQPSSVARFPLAESGETESVHGGWRFAIKAASPAQFTQERRSLRVVLDSEAINGKLFVRSAEPGDVVVPLGMTGRKKLSDLFGECKLTQAARKRLPIVCDMVGPVWVPGICLSDQVKVTRTTGQALELLFGPQSPVDQVLRAT